MRQMLWNYSRLSNPLHLGRGGGVSSLWEGTAPALSVLHWAEIPRDSRGLMDSLGLSKGISVALKRSATNSNVL